MIVKTLVLSGFCAVTAGVAFIFWPAGLIAAGVFAVVTGLLSSEVKNGSARPSDRVSG